MVADRKSLLPITEENGWTFVGQWSVSVESALANPDLHPGLRHMLEHPDEYVSTITPCYFETDA